ncbi:MAG: aminotransferase class I/II-fold pyridoxal phosphate-dependent enzyme [Thermoguttaceae bacterium]|jgi:glycine C-acetyltransferase|nr:aminotransferase class I/II-fold pyridoxal phosphate-dependent enzyme [Thermoguttaceae bacterium]
MAQASDISTGVPDPQELCFHQLIHDKVVGWLRSEGRVGIGRIDYDTSLFELGVDSLGAGSIACELEEEIGRTLNPEVVYELETINELAEYLASLPPRRLSKSDESPVPAEPLDLVEAPAATSSGNGEPDGLLAHYSRMNRRVNSLKQRGLYFFEPEISKHDGAWVVAGGQRMLMLGSYEYLGLLGHPHLKATAIAAIDEFGTGHHGVRLLAGTTTVHRKLEARLAAFMQAEDAVVFSSGYVTNLTAISTLVGRGECVIGDQWNHASIVDGCRMSGAEFREFKHNDMDSLEEELAKTDGRRTLVVVDAVFSMDGDIIDLPVVVELCCKYNALLMVDEAHSVGVLGKTGRGIQEHFGLGPDAIDVKMGTLSKTLAGCGGFIAAREEITTYLRHHARGYIFSGALPAGQASVAIAALEVLDREPELVQRLRENVAHYLAGLRSLGFDTAKSVTPIVPVMTRTDEITLEMTRLCRSEGLLVIPVCYPAVPLDAPRLRTCVSAIHSREDIDFALGVLARAGRQTRLIA